MIKLGNISFNEVAISKMSFDEFSDLYRGKLYGYDLKKAYKVLTGRTPAKPKTTDGKTKGTTKKAGTVRSKRGSK